MTNPIKPSVLLANLSLPEQDLEELSFCVSNKPAVLSKWLENLRATQLNQTAMQLYNAIPEIVQLNTSYQVRLEMLEIVRMRVQDSIEGLQKGFLNQPIIMPEDAQKAVLIAQTLQKSMIDGYLLTALQITQLNKTKKQTMDDLTKTIHRAMTGIGLLFFRSCQIYTQLSQSLWSALHILYQIADHFELTVEPIEDPLLKHVRAVSVTAAYTRVLMLGCAKTNQLSQNDIALAYQIFERWSLHVRLHEPQQANKSNYLVVDLHGQQGPIAKSKVGKDLDQCYLELDFAPLLNQLSKPSSETNHLGPGKVNLVGEDFPTALLRHLKDAWAIDASRKNDRRKVSSAAHVCIGLVDCHYYVNNSIEFDEFVASDRGEAKMPQGIPQSVTPDPKPREESRPSYRVNIQNSSPGGYCLLWQGNIPNKVIAGEIIGIKEIGKRSWDIGVIRWVRQLKGASQFGIQVLSHNPKPYGIAQTYAMGGYSDYMRSFYLPPSRFGHNQPCLLTGSVPFEEKDKVKIADGQQEWSANLDEVIFATKSIQQFTFQTLDKIGDIPRASEPTSEGQYSSWDDI
ncbi:hypothetical protein TDB9533_01476 [Thalassocella blandensis]|nr:hypothetical protein TDB9533_01476 [Thalassocella blandensis]